MPTIKNLNSGATVNCSTGASFRDVAKTQNLDVPFGCENGICSTCLIHIKSGAENLSPKTEQEEFTLEARGIAKEDMTTRLGCQCIVNGDIEFQ